MAKSMIIFLRISPNWENLNPVNLDRIVLCNKAGHGWSPNGDAFPNSFPKLNQFSCLDLHLEINYNSSKLLLWSLKKNQNSRISSSETATASGADNTIRGNTAWNHLKTDRIQVKVWGMGLIARHQVVKHTWTLKIYSKNLLIFINTITLKNWGREAWVNKMMYHRGWN